MPSVHQLRARVDRLTQAMPPAQAAGSERMAEAMTAAYARLRELLPDDPAQSPVIEGFARRIVVDPGARSHADHRAALAGRIKARRLTDADRAVLAGLPRAELRAAGLTAREFVMLMAGVDAEC